MSDLEAVVRLVRATLARVVETERRIGAVEFRGRVAEVDPERHAVRMVIGQTPEGDDVLSPWTPVAQTAGAMKFHDLPSVGQQGSISSANGDIEQARFVPLHWSDGFEAISNDAGLKKMALGAVTVEWDAARILVSVGGSFIEITDGKIRASAHMIAFFGAKHEHNDTNIGDTHVHSDVTPGPADTGRPH